MSEFLDHLSPERRLYLGRALPSHLVHSGEPERLHDLLVAETRDYRNLWFEATMEAGGTLSDYVSTLQLALGVCKQAPDTGTCLPKSIAFECRYALMLSSVNSFISKFPAQRISRLVAEKFITTSDAVTYARQSPHPADQSAILKSIVPYLNANDLAGMLTIARSINDVEERAAALTELAGHLAGESRERALEETYHASSQISSPYRRSVRLTCLSDLVAEPRKQVILEESLRAIADCSRLPEYMAALRWITPRLSDSQRDVAITHFLKAIRLHSQEPRRANDIYDEVMDEVMLDFIENRFRVQPAPMLADLAPYFSETTMREALDVLREIRSADSAKADTLIAFGSHLSHSLLDDALQVARSLISPEDRMRALAQLAKLLPDEQSFKIFDEVLRDISKMDDETTLASVLAKIAPLFKDMRQIEQLLQAAVKMRSKECKITALARLIPALPAHLQPFATSEALGMLDSPGYWKRGAKTEAYLDLAPYLSSRHLGSAIASLNGVKEDWDLQLAMEKLLPRMADLGDGNQAIELACKLKSPWSRAVILADLVPHLPDSLRGETIRKCKKASQEVVNPEERSQLKQVLITQFPFISDEDWEPARVAAQLISDRDSRTWALCNLAPFLPRQYLLTALRSVRDAGPIRQQLGMLAALTVWLIPCLEHSTVRNPLQCSWMGRNLLLGFRLRDQFIALIRRKLLIFLWYLVGAGSLVLFLFRESVNRGPLLYELSVVNLLVLLGWCFLMLPQFVSWMPHGIRSKLIRTLLTPALKRLSDDNLLRVIWALPWIASHLPKSAYDVALEMAWTLPSHGLLSVSRAISSLAPFLPETSLERVLDKTRTKPEDVRAEVEATLIPTLPEALLPKALALARSSTLSGEGRTGSLSAIALRLGRLGRVSEALELARDIRNVTARSVAFHGLVLECLSLRQMELVKLFRGQGHGSDLITSLAQRGREDLLADLLAFAPLIARVGGVEPIRETFVTVQNVGRWWP